MGHGEDENRLMEWKGWGELAFLLDGSLGKLARNLRMFGLNVEVDIRNLDCLMRRAEREGRVLVTRRALEECGSGGMVEMIQVRENLPEKQVVEVLKRVGRPVDKSKWFSRCLICNEPLQEVSPAAVEGNVPDHILLIHSEFRRCEGCGRVYWPGTHRLNMEKRMEKWAKEAWGGSF